MRKNQKHNTVNQAEGTLLFYIQKGHEMGLIPDSGNPCDMGEEPDTYSWFMRQVSNFKKYDDNRRFLEISKLIQYMASKNMLVELELNREE